MLFILAMGCFLAQIECPGQTWWSKDRPPLIRGVENAVAVADKNGIEVYVVKGDDWIDGENVVRLNLEMTPGLAKLIPDSLPSRVDLEQLKLLGFE